jgi:uncharacterized Zn finger protein
MKFGFSQETLKKLAGEAAYARGADYFRYGHVTEIHYGKQRVTATVEGTDTWAVTLNFRARGLDGACDCPASEGVDFCKHCVAVGLTVLAEQEQVSRLENGSESDRIKAWLLGQSKEVLADQLMELTAADRGLRQRYLLRMAVSEQGIDYKALRKQITAAIHPAGNSIDTRRCGLISRALMSWSTTWSISTPVRIPTNFWS